MTAQNDLPMTTEPADSDESRYRIHSRLEIAAVLESLRKERSLVTAYFGEEFFVTAVASVSEPDDHVVLGCGPDAAANERALHAKSIVFTASHQRIKVQFDAASLRLVRFDGGDAFCIPLPATLLRLQRREYFRIDAPLRQPLKCVIPKRGAKTANLQASILDISCGGVAMADAGEGTDFQTGMLLRGCSITLPDIGAVTADLMVRNAFDVTLRNGAKVRRFGLQFVNIAERSRALIQRYINAMERERRSRAGAG